jgi:catechol 1,2-dioxygenase
MSILSGKRTGRTEMKHGGFAMFLVSNREYHLCHFNDNYHRLQQQHKHLQSKIISPLANTFPSSLVDEINHKIVTDKDLSPTSSAILGPFWSPDTPFRDLGSSVVQNMPKDGQLTLFHGVIKDAETGKGIPDAVFDMWQASTNGKYDVFDPENQTRHNLRGKFRSDENGKFWFYCLKPTEYAIDTSGPSADLLRIMGRHPYRPAHIHMMVTHPEYIGVTAQLYPNDDQYLETDTVSAVKEDLLLDFKPLKDDPEGAVLDVEYDVRLLSRKYKPDSTMLMGNANQDNF